jgi:hypothetical protein
MHGRIRFITHAGKKILFVDLSGSTAAEIQDVMRALPDHVATQPYKSVLLLADFKGARFDDEALRSTQQAAVFDKPFVRKSAWIGVEMATHFAEKVANFSRRDFPTFETREEALSWLVSD